MLCEELGALRLCRGKGELSGVKSLGSVERVFNRSEELVADLIGCLGGFAVDVGSL